MAPTGNDRQAALNSRYYETITLKYCARRAVWVCLCPFNTDCSRRNEKTGVFDSGSNQVARRAEATIFLAPFSGAGEFGPIRARFRLSGKCALHRATKCLIEDSDPR